MEKYHNVLWVLLGFAVGLMYGIRARYIQRQHTIQASHAAIEARCLAKELQTKLDSSDPTMRIAKDSTVSKADGHSKADIWHCCPACGGSLDTGL